MPALQLVLLQTYLMPCSGTSFRELPTSPKHLSYLDRIVSAYVTSLLRSGFVEGRATLDRVLLLERNLLQETPDLEFE